MKSLREIFRHRRSKSEYVVSFGAEKRGEMCTHDAGLELGGYIKPNCQICILTALSKKLYHCIPTMSMLSRILILSYPCNYIRCEWRILQVTIPLIHLRYFHNLWHGCTECLKPKAAFTSSFVNEAVPSTNWNQQEERTVIQEKGVQIVDERQPQSCLTTA